MKMDDKEQLWENWEWEDKKGKATFKEATGQCPYLVKPCTWSTQFILVVKISILHDNYFFFQYMCKYVPFTINPWLN